MNLLLILVLIAAQDNGARSVTDVEVIDGDTIRCDVQLGADIVLHDQTFRLYGINAYETSRRGTWDDDLTEDQIQAHLEQGAKGKEAMEKIVEQGITIQFVVEKGKYKKGKYGRWLCTVWTVDEKKEKRDVNVNMLLVEKGLAVEKDY